MASEQTYSLLLTRSSRHTYKHVRGNHHGDNHHGSQVPVASSQTQPVDRKINTHDDPELVFDPTIWNPRNPDAFRPPGLGGVRQVRQHGHLLAVSEVKKTKCTIPRRFTTPLRGFYEKRGYHHMFPGAEACGEDEEEDEDREDGEEENDYHVVVPRGDEDTDGDADHGGDDDDKSESSLSLSSDEDDDDENEEDDEDEDGEDDEDNDEDDDEESDDEESDDDDEEEDDDANDDGEGNEENEKERRVLEYIMLLRQALINEVGAEGRDAADVMLRFLEVKEEAGWSKADKR
ncbi:hypothetical protein F5X99DRAFT_406381 [Biscogniauxia marginata]|nr:hypothetical protein F5X99DRAFT_406381 [Biscogniauxia marginata]